MLAIQAALDPKVLDGSGEPIYEIDEKTGRRSRISRAQFKHAITKYSVALLFLFDLDGGRVSISLADYQRLPAVVMEAWRIVRCQKQNMEPDANRPLAS